MNHKLWIAGFLVIIISLLSFTAIKVAEVDPFIHYHKPDTEKYAYRLNNERSQNDGIIKHFDYSGMITGTSMCENFRTTDAESLWGGRFIKTAFSGASYKEINDSIRTAAAANEHLEIVIRGLDMALFRTDKDLMSDDLGNYPFYLYDDDPFNDVNYLFNRDVVFSRVYKMIADTRKADFQSGITSFDSYANWMPRKTFGKNSVLPEGVAINPEISAAELTEEDVITIRENIGQNVTALADEYPEITFYYFFTPYSGAFWLERYNSGEIGKQIQMERVVIEEILEHENIKLFSFNCRFDMITDLNNYKDRNHYGEWINSWILKRMHDGEGLLTKENYEEYLDTEYEFFSNYDYSRLLDTDDYENDQYAGAVLNHEITGAVPFHVDLQDPGCCQLSHAEVKEDQYNGRPGVVCTGALQRSPEQPLGDYLFSKDYIGIRIGIEDITPYNYLVFYGKKSENRGQPTIRIFDKDGAEIVSYNKRAGLLDNNWQEYVIDTRDVKGPAVLILNGGCPDMTGEAESRFIFSDITLY